MNSSYNEIADNFSYNYCVECLTLLRFEGIHAIRRFYVNVNIYLHIDSNFRHVVHEYNKKAHNNGILGN